MPSAHARTDIRKAIVTALTGLHTTGAHVFPSRMYPSDSKMPCLLVITNDEQNIGEGLNSPLERPLDVVIRCTAKDSADLDTVLDTMIAEVETAMNAAGTLNSLVTDISAPKSISIAEDMAQDKPVGIADVHFVVTYFTNAGAPGTTV